jgi:DinB family protein
MFHCDECDFTYDLDCYESAVETIAAGSGDIARLVGGPDRPADDVVRTRPAPDVWSVLEYGCHVRDVLLVQRERVLLARRAECPTFPPMGRDERVEHDAYAEQSPVDVARQLTDAAGLLVNVFDRLGADDWERTVVYNLPEPTERSLRWVAVHTEHEVRHHLLDVRRQLP